MNPNDFRLFLEVAELGSFTKASAILNIAQPALSRQVRLLETDLHVSLLTRNATWKQAPEKCSRHGQAKLEPAAKHSIPRKRCRDCKRTWQQSPKPVPTSDVSLRRWRQLNIKKF